MRRALAVIACLVVFGAACSKANTPAATVNGDRITDQEVLDELNAISGNADYLAAVESEVSSGGLRVKGDNPGSYDPAFVAAVLQLHIRDSLIHQEVVNRKLQVDDTCRSAARQDTYSGLGAGDQTKGKAIFDTFTKAYQDAKLQRDAESLVLQANLVNMPCQSANAAQDYFNAHPDQFTQSCVSLIVVDPAAAAGVLAQLQAGADFATLAQQVSTHAATKDKGGDAGCYTQQQGIPAELTDAIFSTPVGSVAAPVQRSDGANIIKVTSRSQPSFADVEQQASELAANAANQAFSQWLRDAVGRASVSVAARYGTWNKDTLSIDPPGGTTTTTTTTPTIETPQSTSS